MSAALPLDRRKAIDKMLAPSWQKRGRGVDAKSNLKPGNVDVPVDKKRSQQEVTCIECGKKRMINKGAVMPARCKACALNHGWGRKP